jgi:hypothetical protein
MTRLSLALLALGLLWRSVRYLLAFPIWGDEAMLGVSIAKYGYLELTQRLGNCQIAPLLFLWGERLALTCLGPSECSMRVLPFLAGVLSLVVFWRLATRLLGEHARLFAVGFLAVAIWPTSMSTLLKPYSMDLFVSLLLLTAAVEWLQQSSRARWLIVLTGIALVAPLASYTSVFVAAGVSLATFPTAWRAGASTRCWHLAFNVALLMGFTATYIVSQNHLSDASLGSTTREGMVSYWREAFPPDSLWMFLPWLFLMTAGEMFAYPIGASDGGSIATVVLAGVGLYVWRRRGGWPLLVLLTAPFAFNLIAAVLERYPFGGSCRVAQHLAPAICLSAGLGASFLVRRYAADVERRRRLTLASTAAFALIGTGGMVRDILFPYRERCWEWVRDTMAEIVQPISSNERVVISGDQIDPVFTWYWWQYGDRVSWNGRLPSEAERGRRLWLFHSGSDSESVARRYLDELKAADPAWELSWQARFDFIAKRKRDSQRTAMFSFERATGGEQEPTLAATSIAEKTNEGESVRR